MYRKRNSSRWRCETFVGSVSIHRNIILTQSLKDGEEDLLFKEYQFLKEKGTNKINKQAKSRQIKRHESITLLDLFVHKEVLCKRVHDGKVVINVII